MKFRTSHMIIKRIETLAEMDYFIRQCGDEGILTKWLICGVPDYTTLDQLFYNILNCSLDDDIFENTCQEFCDLLRFFPREVKGRVSTRLLTKWKDLI